MTLSLEDRFVGCMLGLAVGDALGMPTEGFTAEEIKDMFGLVEDMMPSPPGHFHTGLLAGQYTDDTEETMILARSILSGHGFFPQLFAEGLKDWGASWVLDESLNRGVGFTTRSAVEALIAGTDWRTSGLDLPTCGAAMRVAPVGLVYHGDLSLLARYSELQSIPTHSGAPARAGAAAVAAGVALSLQGMPARRIIDQSASIAGRIDPEMERRLRTAESLLELDPAEASIMIGSSPSVYETVPAAFYFFAKLPGDQAVIQAASLGGDTDSIASMAGALAGAKEGSRWIRDRWLAVLEGRDEIAEIGRRLFHLSEELASCND
jgi:ADP-ribosylglycohydrolase